MPKSLSIFYPSPSQLPDQWESYISLGETTCSCFCILEATVSLHTLHVKLTTQGFHKCLSV